MSEWAYIGIIIGLLCGYPLLFFCKDIFNKQYIYVDFLKEGKKLTRLGLGYKIQEEYDYDRKAWKIVWQTIYLKKTVTFSEHNSVTLIDKFHKGDPVNWVRYILECSIIEKDIPNDKPITTKLKSSKKWKIYNAFYKWCGKDNKSFASGAGIFGLIFAVFSFGSLEALFAGCIVGFIVSAFLRALDKYEIVKEEKLDVVETKEKWIVGKIDKEKVEEIYAAIYNKVVQKRKFKRCE